MSSPAQESLLEQALEARYRGALAEARGLCATILRRAPQDAQALTLMAAIEADERQIDAGMKWAAAAMASDEGLAEPHYVMGRLWELAGRPAEAEASYRRAAELDPRHARAHNNLGGVLRLQDRHEEALACFRQALAIDPAQAEANQNLASMTNDSASQERAITGYLRQIAADPTDARAFANLANIYLGLGRWREAMAALDRCLELDPQRAEAHYARALFLLRSGDYRAGWLEYEWRWRLGNRLSEPARRFSQPIWDGRPVDGAVLLHGEPPFGETIQFVRYARLVAARSRGVILQCARELHALMRRVEGVAQVIGLEEEAPRFAAHAPLLALPRVFDTTLENLPWPGPYIKADAARAAEWQDACGASPSGRLSVGLVWTGNPNNPNNLDRSVPPEKLAALAQVPGVDFYSLQKGQDAAGRRRAAEALPLVDLTDRLRDFSDTAALVSRLDLVISIDTAVAHLAAAMGRPVWVLLNRVPDWRYHLDRPDNPWYPTMRLHRQTREGDWDGVIERVAAALRGFAA